MMVEFSKGLEGVIADESRICKINAKPAGLFYMGFAVEQLAEACSFLEVTYLLFHGQLPTQKQLIEFETKVRQLRKLPTEVEKIIQLFPKNVSPMHVLQTAVAALGAYQFSINPKDSSAVIQAMTALIAQLPVIIGLYYRHQQGIVPLIPDAPELDYPSYFLYLVTGKKPDSVVSQVFDRCLILHAEHSANASTFTARVVASTLADIYASVSAAVGALSGPLHGGANEGAVRMAEEVGHPEKAKAWVETQLAQKKKVFGFGHRVYRDVDPRSIVLENLFSKIPVPPKTQQKFKTLQTIRDVFGTAMTKAGKDLYPNVDLFSGVLYEALGIPLTTYTSVFAMARMAGWGAHIIELWKDNRLYRPELQYVGPLYDHVPKRLNR